MLTECVFIVIIFSTYLTWHSKYLFPKREMAKSKTKVEPSQINLEYHEASIKKRIKTISKVKSWHVFCAWTSAASAIAFWSPSRPPTAEARTRTFSLSTSPTTSILRIPTQIPQGFSRLLQWTCKPSLCPGRGWGRWSPLWLRSGFLVSLGRSLACSSSSLSFPALSGPWLSWQPFSSARVTSQISYKREPSCSSLRQMPPGHNLKNPTPPPSVQVLMSASISANSVTECIDHHFRSCDDNDSFFFAILLQLIAIFSILSYQLHQLSSYSKLSGVSQTALPCCSPKNKDDSDWWWFIYKREEDHWVCHSFTEQQQMVGGINMTPMCHILTFPGPSCRPSRIFMVQHGWYRCPAYSTTCFRFNLHLWKVF